MGAKLVEVIKNKGLFLFGNEKFYRILTNDQIHPLNKEELKIFKRYVSSAKHRQIEFKLTKLYFKQLINKKCTYCNSAPNTYGGIDRINSSGDYDIYNVTPCCAICNRAKHTSSYPEFDEYMNNLRNITDEQKYNEITEIESPKTVFKFLGFIEDTFDLTVRRSLAEFLMHNTEIVNYKSISISISNIQRTIDNKDIIEYREQMIIPCFVNFIELKTKVYEMFSEKGVYKLLDSNQLQQKLYLLSKKNKGKF